MIVRNPCFLIACFSLSFSTGCEEEQGPTSSAAESPAVESLSESKPESPQDMKPPKDPKDNDFVGMSEADANKLAKKRGLKSRVVERDGRLLPATRDYRPDRVNFSIEKGKVKKVSRG